MSDAPPAPETSSRSSRPRRRRVLGVILLVIALVALVGRNIPLRADHLVLLAAGVVFIAWAVLARSIGLLVPGCLLAGIGAGTALQRYYGYGPGSDYGQGIFLFCLAGGFLLITAFSGLFFRRKVFWPAWPATFIAVAGLIRMGEREWRYYFHDYWPIALLLVAVWLLLSSFRKTGR